MIVGIGAATLLGSMYLFATDFDETEATAWGVWFATTTVAAAEAYRRMRKAHQEATKEAIAAYLNEQKEQARRLMEDDNGSCDSSMITLPGR